MVSVDQHVQGSDSQVTVEDVLILAWTGMEMLLRKVENSFKGTLEKMPGTATSVNALTGINNVCCQYQYAILY